MAMSLAAWLIWSISLILLAILLLLDWRGGRIRVRLETVRPIVFLLTFFILTAVLVILIEQNISIEHMSATPAPFPWATVGLLYLAMLLGMAAQYYFYQDDQLFSISIFIRPMLASPIIFIPLVSAYQKAIVGVDQFELGDLMLLLVAFQNGFFWKILFDRQQQKSGKA